MSELTKEQKDLLIQDLACRIPHHVVVENTDPDDPSVNFICYFTGDMLHSLMNGTNPFNYRPYLRSMDEMTEEEAEQYSNCQMYLDDLAGDNRGYVGAGRMVRWLIENHFDYQNLIPKGLAIKVTLDNDPYILPKEPDMVLQFNMETGKEYRVELIEDRTKHVQ